MYTTTTLTAWTKWLSRPVASCLLVAWLLCGAVGCASDKSAQFLFVQTADRVTFQGDTMTMHGVSPTTLFFSDRPERIMGHQDTLVFVNLWSEGDDSFAKNPPNAALTILGDDESEVSEIVVELQHPRLVNGNLSYQITVLDGTPPETGGVNALFIDAIVITDPHVIVVPRRVIVAPAYGPVWYRAAPPYGGPWYGGQERRVARRTARRVARRR